MRNCSFIPVIAALLCTPLAFASLHIAGAQVMSSTNFQIQSDSVNAAGGFSSSTNYSLESTAGEVGTGPSDSGSYSLRTGYQQMQDVYIAMSVPVDVTMDTLLGGITGGESNGSTTVTVVTDSPVGYQLTIQSENNPAMQSGANIIADYTPVGAAPDRLFLTDASDSHLAYTPNGADTVQRFQTNGAVCDIAGSASSTACWDGLSTVAEPIAQSTGSNHPAGTATDIYFRVGIGGSANQAQGVYTATTTLTAIPL